MPEDEKTAPATVTPKPEEAPKVEVAPKAEPTPETPAAPAAPAQPTEPTAETPQPAPVKPKKKIHTAKPIKLFDKYDTSEFVVHDPGLIKYMNLDPIIVPHTGARHANRWFGKTKMNIVERLINNMMRTEVFTGKKSKAYTTVKKAFEIVEQTTKQNPVQVLVDAIENAAPREEVTRLKYGGISVPKAVDVSSARRLDTAVRNISTGAVQSSYKSTKRIEQCLANEIILAAKKDMNSFAVAKKEEVERVAGSAR